MDCVVMSCCTYQIRQIACIWKVNIVGNDKASGDISGGNKLAVAFP